MPLAATRDTKDCKRKFLSFARYTSIKSRLVGALERTTVGVRGSRARRSLGLGVESVAPRLGLQLARGPAELAGGPLVAGGLVVLQGLALRLRRLLLLLLLLLLLGGRLLRRGLLERKTG